jgi:hypothetical protein
MQKPAVKSATDDEVNKYAVFFICLLFFYM